MHLRRIKVLAVIVPLLGLLGFELFRHFVLHPATGEQAPHFDEHLISAAILFVAVMAFTFWIFRLLEHLHDQLVAVNQASIAVTGDLSADLVLERMAELARTVADASYASVRVEVTPQRTFAAGTAPANGRILSLPIVVKGERLGELVLAGPRGRTFRSADRSALETFATQAGIALENARLFEQEQELVAARERARIGMDLHDGLIQELYGLGLKVEDAAGLVSEEPEEALHQLKEVQAALRDAISQIRVYVYGLKGGDRSVELSPALEHLLSEFPSADPRVELHVDRDERLPALVAANLLHIVREAVANSLRHAQASRVTIRVTSEDSRLVVEVEDDGRGFDPGIVSSGLGIADMRERAGWCRCELTILSTPGAGTKVRMVSPSEAVSLSGTAGSP